MRRLPKAASWILGVVCLTIVFGLVAPTAASGRPSHPSRPRDIGWADPARREAFLMCMRRVDWVAYGQAVPTTPRNLGDPEARPDGVSRDEWRTAIDAGFFDTLLTARTWWPFVFRPRCNTFLPPGWTDQVPAELKSDAFDRCVANLDETDEPRPGAVPAWYWEVSMEIGSCYLLLPIGAFGYLAGEVSEQGFAGYPNGIDVTPWSSWRTSVDPSAAAGSDPNYTACLDFVDWRMVHTQDADPADALADSTTYGNPASGSVTFEQWHEAIDFYVDPNGPHDDPNNTTTPATWRPDCGLLPGDGSIGNPGATDPDGPGGFVWDDPDLRDAFAECMEIVDRVAITQVNAGTSRIAPGDVPEDLWGDAIHDDWFDWNWSLIVDRVATYFTYRPKCHLLLPTDYVSRIPTRYWSEAFSRCTANVSTGDRNHERPQVVPAWHWEVSMEVGDCYLLLPLGAFGLGEEDNGWSTWSSEDEVNYPDSNDNPDIMAEYQHCKDFIPWRMDGGAAFAGLGDLYDDPPEGASVPRIWHEALNYYSDPGSTGGDASVTTPATWRPICELLLLENPCTPNTDVIVPELCVGPHATSHYDIGYQDFDDPETREPSISRNLWGGTTGLVYQLGKGAIQVALWIVDWSFMFDIRKYDPLAIDVGDAYQDNLLGELVQLRQLLWLVLFAWAGFVALRGRLGMAGTEVLLSVLLLLVAGVLLDNRATYLTSTWNLMDEASTAVLVAGNGGDPGADGGMAGRQQLVLDTQEQIHHIFVEEPYDHLNWGRSLGRADDPDNPLAACAAARYQILSRGPHGTDDWPRRVMTTAGGGRPEEMTADEVGGTCGDLVEFNREPSGTRLMGAVLVMTSAIFVSVLLLLVALTVVVCKFIALLLFAVAPLAAAVTILPGAGRRLAWSWAATLVQMVVAVIGVSFLLSLLLLTLTALSELSGDIPLVERFLLMNLIVLVVFAARRSLLNSGQRFAARLSEYLASTRGMGTTWASAAAHARGGVNLLNVDRAVGGAVGAPAAAAWDWHVWRRRSRYQAKLAYKNLQAVSYWKRAQNARTYITDPRRPWQLPSTRSQNLP